MGETGDEQSPMSAGIESRLPSVYGADRRRGDVWPAPPAMVLRRASDGPRPEAAEPTPERTIAYLPSSAFIAQVLGQRQPAAANDSGFAAYRATQLLGRENPRPVLLSV